LQQRNCGGLKTRWKIDFGIFAADWWILHPGCGAGGQMAKPILPSNAALGTRGGRD